MLDYIILDSETRMPIPNMERFSVDCCATLYETIDGYPKHVPKEGKYIIVFYDEDEKPKEVRY